MPSTVTTPLSPIADPMDLFAPASYSLTSPPTPPLEAEPSTPSPCSLILPTALLVLSTEARALVALEQFYATSLSAQTAFTQSVQLLASTIQVGGKLIVCGIGKSGKIGEKLVATCNSLGLVSVFLHPGEAMHGDLGVVSGHDLILLITFSGSTPELQVLLPHLPTSCPKIILTSHTSASTCSLATPPPITNSFVSVPGSSSSIIDSLPSPSSTGTTTPTSSYTPRDIAIPSMADVIILPAPTPESETATFGIPAPTTSTTVALALGDALAIATAKYLHEGLEGRESKGVFARNHPGGALGKALWKGAI